ncbi:hypothetical protein [Paraburkholderia sp. SOS3]|jgi:hypothetical protein|uniref:hypothetical protein n=1 Tax=Paraburkholderia sp. SOS3 TaxID=1926494 RepID=UPI0012EC9B1E|nr:hypothetical protein [Paraburkholderia sp. SOS3]
MSTPISGSTVPGLLGALDPQDQSANANRTKASQAGTASDAGSLAAAALAAAMQAAASVGQLAQAFGQAAQGATTVDPSTGLREVSATSNAQLGSALDQFLVQNGFSQQQADAASKSFVEQLQKGGPVDLNASFDESTTVATAVSSSYGSTTMSASSVAVNERSGSVSIDFDPTTGKLSISLKEQQISSVTSVTEISGPGAAALPILALQAPTGILNLLPGHAGRGNGDGNDATNDQNPATLPTGANNSTANEAAQVLSQLLAALARPTLHGTEDASNRLSQANRDKGSGTGSADGADGANGAGETNDAPSSAGQAADEAISVTIGFTQAVSISLLDLNGHGTTIFRRPDGNTGAMSFEPTHVVAS